VGNEVPRSRADGEMCSNFFPRIDIYSVKVQKNILAHKSQHFYWDVDCISFTDGQDP